MAKEHTLDDPNRSSLGFALWLQSQSVFVNLCALKNSVMCCCWKDCSVNVSLVQWIGRVCYILADHCASLPDAHCLENHCFILLSALVVVSGGRVNPVIAAPSWTKIEVALTEYTGNSTV